MNKSKVIASGNHFRDGLRQQRSSSNVSRDSSTLVNDIPWSWMNEEIWRLHSFAKYSFDMPKSVILLAQNGFVYNGSGAELDDSVACFFCNRSKSGWSVEDEIIDVHRDLGPACPMITGARSTNLPLAVHTTVPLSSNRDRVYYRTNLEDIGAAVGHKPGQVSSLSSQVTQTHPHNQYFGPPKRAQVQPSTVSSPALHTYSGEDSTHRREALSETNVSSITKSRDTDPANNPMTGDYLSSGAASRSEYSSDSHQLRQDNSHVKTVRRSPSSNQFTHLNLANQPTSISQNNQSSNRPTVSINQSPNQLASTSQNNQSLKPASASTAALDQTSNQLPTTNTTADPTDPFRNPTIYHLGIIKDKPKLYEYAVQQKRLETFQEWPLNHHIKARDLADAGFYYLGSADHVRCFYCDGKLRDWEEGDDAWVEHAHWFPRCGFLQQIVGRDFIDTVVGLFQLPETAKITLQMVVKKMNIDLAKFQRESRGISLDNDPAVQAVREVGYKNDDILQAASLLKEKSHALSADELFETLDTRRSVQIHLNPGGKDSSEADGVQTEQEILDRIKESNTELRLQYTCKVCIDKAAAVVFLPCGHLACCIECASAVRDCPVCRRMVNGRVRAVMA